MDDILKDSRFTKLINDPRYREIPKTQRKVKIDKRFQSMFDNEKFKIKYTIDKRGKPINQTSTENLKKYYDLSSEESDDSEDSEEEDETGKFVRPPKQDGEKSDEDEEKSDEDEEKSDVDEDKPEDDIAISSLDRSHVPKEVRKKLRDLDTDYARGDGVLFSDSSSEEEESDSDGEQDVEHGWGELDADADTCEDATHRLAICNMDWDNIEAADLFVLFNSFLPPGGLIKSVTIYPSEFGLQRMKEEELRGPIELTESKKKEKKNNSDTEEEENEEGSRYHMEKLRKYQLNRLKYYYAVVVFDSATTANKVYTDCDGIEYESSATRLDLRFIPDDVTFDQEKHEECTEIPEISRYKPRLFTTTALQQAKVELTWDATNPQRSEFLKEAAEGDVRDEDIKNYLAYSSSEESENECVKQQLDESDHDGDKMDPVSKYKALLQEIEESDSKKKNRDVEMEITWGLGLKEKTQELVQKKLNKPEKLTPFEEMVEKHKEKKKAKKLEKKKAKMEEKKNSDDEYSSDDIPSDIDMNDPYFAEEFESKDFKKKSKKKGKMANVDNADSEMVKKKQAELELLLDDDDNKAHFSLKKIQEAENETKSKKKRQKHKRKEDTNKADVGDFEINVNDDRFSALFSSHHYNIDPTDPNYKKTKAMEKLIQEKLKRRPGEDDPKDLIEPKRSRKDPAISVLVNNIKRKTGNLDFK